MKSLTFVTLLALISPAYADVVTIGADHDACMFNESAAEANGAGDYFHVGVNGLSQIRRGLISFNVAGSVPAGSTIVAAELRLYMSKTNAGPMDIRLHEALEAWGEGSSNPSMGEGGGAPATTGDCTWYRRIFPTPLWTVAGGTFDPTAGASTNVHLVGFYTWTTTPGLRLDVQGWLDSPSTNFGWVLVNADEVSIPSAKRFDSRQNFNASTRPQLTITYSPPNCGGAVNYCTAAPNSTGLGAQITHTGSRSLTANTFGLTCIQLPPNSTGVFYLGPTQTSVVFGNGFRCVTGSVIRLNPPVVADGAGVVSRAIDFTLPPVFGAITPGSTKYFQYWYRNPAGGGAGFNLSDGLCVTFCD